MPTALGQAGAGWPKSSMTTAGMPHLCALARCCSCMGPRGSSQGTASSKVALDRTGQAQGEHEATSLAAMPWLLPLGPV